MPTRAKKAKAKAKGKAQRNAKAAMKPSPPPSSALVLSEPDPFAPPPDDDVPSAAKKRRLNRRCSDEQVERALHGRFSRYPSAVWESKRDANGKSVRETVREGLKAANNGSTKGRLSTKFWTTLRETFGLSESLASDLPDPGTTEPVDKSLLECLKVGGLIRTGILMPPMNFFRPPRFKGHYIVLYSFFGGDFGLNFRVATNLF